MALDAEKKKLVGELDRYLKGKHDEEKNRIASACREMVKLALNYRELVDGLEAYQAELTRLVVAKNLNRWFKHKAGDLDKLLAQAIARCQVAVENERKMFSGFLVRPSTTVKDWNRNAGGKSFLVNKKAFTATDAQLEDIRNFLTTAGIGNAHIREFLCDHANQDGLFASGHLFSMAATQAGVAPSYSGSFHEITSTTQTSCVHCRDEAHFDAVMSMSNPRTVQIDPPLKLVQSYDLVEDHGNVSLANISYSIENLESLPESMRSAVATALESVSVP